MDDRNGICGRSGGSSADDLHGSQAQVSDCQGCCRTCNVQGQIINTSRSALSLSFLVSFQLLVQEESIAKQLLVCMHL